MNVRTGLVLLLGVMVAACSHGRHAAKSLAKQAAFDLNCQARHVRVAPVGGRGSGQFVAEGCGRQATYVEGPDGLQLAGPVQGAPFPGSAQPNPQQPRYQQPTYQAPPSQPVYTPPPGQDLPPPPPPPQ